MSMRLSAALLPALALTALCAAGAPARAADDNPYGLGQYTAFGAQTDGQARRAAANRIYIPLHPAQPRDVADEFAPAQATVFGTAPFGRPAVPSPGGSAAGGKAAAGPSPGVRLGTNNGTAGQAAPPAKGG